MPSEGIEGDEWGAYVTLSRISETNAGSPTGREPYGDTGPVVVAGVTTCQGGGNTVRRAKGARRWMSQLGKAGVMPGAEPVLIILRGCGRGVIAGEPRAGKPARGVRTVGRWKRTRLGGHLASDL